MQDPFETEEEPEEVEIELKLNFLDIINNKSKKLYRFVTYAEYPYSKDNQKIVLDTICDVFIDYDINLESYDDLFDVFEVRVDGDDFGIEDYFDDENIERLKTFVETYKVDKKDGIDWLYESIKN